MNAISSEKPNGGCPPGEPAAPSPTQGPTESVMGVWLGLIVIWVCLTLVFTAHRLSESYIRLEAPDKPHLNRDQTLLRALEPNVKLLLPFSMYTRGTSPIEALSNVAEQVGFHLDIDRLNRFGIDNTKRRIHYESKPLFEVIHDLLRDSTLGFAVKGRELVVFRQSLETEKAGAVVRSLDWKAQLDLNTQRMLIVPTSAIDLWFSIRLTGRPDVEPVHWRTVQLELWRGPEWITMSRAQLDATGYAQLNLATADRISFEIRRIEPPEAQMPGAWRLGLHFETFE